MSEPDRRCPGYRLVFSEGTRGMERDKRAASRASILLLDAHDVERKLYAEALREAGFDVISVASSDEALAAVTERVPRMIVASFDPDTREDRFVFCVRLR